MKRQQHQSAAVVDGTRSVNKSSRIRFILIIGAEFLRVEEILEQCIIPLILTGSL